MKIATHYNVDHTPASKEQIKDVVDTVGLWRGHSYEWRIATQTELLIIKTSDETYQVTASCGPMLILVSKLSFDAAFKYLDKLNAMIIDLYYLPHSM